MKLPFKNPYLTELRDRLCNGGIVFISAIVLVLAGTLGSFAPALGLICLVLSLWAYRELRVMKPFNEIPSSLWIAIEIIGGVHFFMMGKSLFGIGAAIALSLTTLSLVAMHFRYSVTHLSLSWMAYLYITVPLYCLSMIAQGIGAQGVGTQGGIFISDHILSLGDRRWWLAFSILCPKVYDMSAYFFGKKWGRSLLAKNISPKKTVEGALGGFIAVLLFLTFFLPPFSFNAWISLFPIAILISLCAQFGDLFESWIKRGSHIKDSGHIPGLGGVLDILDALLWTSPLFLWLMQGGLEILIKF